MEMSKEEFERLENLIKSEESVVGFDAKKTHVIILHKLEQIEKRLAEIEEKCKK